MVLGPFAPGYVPRLTERSVLHEVVRENLETFLAQARARTEHGFGVPRFVDEEFRAFIRCGVINHGFARVRLRNVLPRVLRRLLVQAPGRVPVMCGAARRCVCHPARGRGLPLDTDADVDPHLPAAPAVRAGAAAALTLESDAASYRSGRYDALVLRVRGCGRGSSTVRTSRAARGGVWRGFETEARGSRSGD